MSEVIAFSEEQQAAIIGHALRTPQHWELLDQFGVTKEWVLDARVKTLMEKVSKFRENYKRPPTGAELLAEISGHETPAQVASSKAIAKTCWDAAKIHGWDVLEIKLIEWAKSRIVINRTTEIAARFNEGKHDSSFGLFEQAQSELAMIDLLSGDRDRIESSPNQLAKFHSLLEGPPVETIKYGISFLDDLTYGLGPNDLHIVTAYTGVGKTELAKNVAVHNALLGKRISFFALEADPQEIEKRIVFGLFYDWYKADHPHMLPGTLNYAEFDLRRLNKLYEPYKERAQAYFEKHFKTLNTYYRKAQEFTIKTLESRILAVHKQSDLIILDHIHYVDTEGRDENREMQEIVKKVRDLSVHLGTPMLVLAHVRKHQGSSKEKRLLPDTDSIQGSGAITKMATAVIALGRGENIACVDHRAVGIPTLMQATKFRKDGPRTRFTGLSFFDEHSRIYREDYALGKLEKAGTKWGPLKDAIPFWARGATITDISDTE
jgi:replicative DNA helicase